VRANGVDLAIFENNDPIRIADRRYSLGYDYLCGIGYLLKEGFSYECVRMRIDCACRVIKNENSRFLEQCPCDTKALLLSAGYVGASLLDIGIVACGEFTYESVGLSEFTGVYELFVSSIGIAS